MLQGPDQLWELSASSMGSSHCSFQRRCSLRAQRVLLGILSHAPEALTQRPAKVLVLGAHSSPCPCPFSVCLQSHKTFPSRMCSRLYTHLHLRQLMNHTKTEGRRKENAKPWAKSSNKQTNKTSCLFPEFDHLFEILSPWRCFPTKKCDKRVFLPV